MRARTNISLKERKVFKLDGFLGADFSSSPLDVKPSHAADMRNLINKNGITRKRNGWRQVLGFGKKIMINGIFQYRNKDGHEWLVVHAGGAFYKVDKESFDVEEIETNNYVIRAQRSEAYLREGRLYIVGAGDYLVYGTWNDGVTYEIRRVEDDEDTYIPTTTININCMDESADDVQGTLDEPNLLCSKRINRLVGKNESAKWILDSAIEENTDVTVKVEKTDNGKIIEEEYVNSDKDNKTLLYKKGDTSVEIGSIEFVTGMVTLNFSTSGVANMDNISVNFTPQKTKTAYTAEIFTLKDLTDKINTSEYVEIKTIPLKFKVDTDKPVNVEMIVNGKTEYNKNNGSVTDPFGIKNQTSGGVVEFNQVERIFNNDQALIIVRYYKENDNNVKEDEDELTSEDISKCTFGTLFGVYGNTDRLFLAGNPDRPHMDFYSAADDYTYFTASQCAALGSDTSPIGGYARLSDSTLAVFKENADNEASIYFRTGKLNEEYDAEGNLVEGGAVFPLTAGALGETIAARYACANLAGDNIMLSRNGVHGIVLGENVALAERHTRERSRAVNKKLLAHGNLSDAVGVVFENRYYLAVDGVCYVADARHKYKRKDDIDGSYNYEWWYFDNVPARIWSVVDGKLFFGTADGRICVFDDEYSDRTFIDMEKGQIGISNGSSEITYQNGLSNFENGDELEITGASSPVYAVYSVNDITGVYEETVLYKDYDDNAYTVTKVDIANNRFTLSDDSKITVSNGGIDTTLYRLISGEKLRVIEKDKKDSHFGVALWGDDKNTPLKISSRNNNMPSDITVRVTHREPVVAEWRSGYYDLGTRMASKTVLGMTVTTEPELEGNVKVGFDTRYHSGAFDVFGNKPFAFDDMDFFNFSFDTGFATSYTRRLNKRNVNYISFYYRSEDDKCCALNSIELLYKVNKNNRGVN